MDQFHSVHRPGRGINLRQYVYEIGSYHYNWHPELELLVILSGDVEVCEGGRVTVHIPGDVVLINSGVGHATLARSPRSHALLLHLDPVFFADYYPAYARLRFDCVSTESTRGAAPFVRLRGLMARMMLDSVDSSSAGRLRYERYLVELADTLVTHFPPVVVEQSIVLGDDTRVRAISRMLTFIERHYAERITLERLGRESGYSPGYVSQVFTKHLGSSMLEYVTRVRLRQAARDLCDPDMKVVDVASNNGFPDVKAFNVAFRKTFGKAPTEYRRHLTEDSSIVDATFKKRFVRRDDPHILTRLRTLASALEAPVGMPTTPSIAEPALRLRELAGGARALAEQLDQVQVTLDRLSSGLE